MKAYKIFLSVMAMMVTFSTFAQNKDRERNIVLPQSDVHYREVKSYVEDVPDDDYIHASEKAHEAFRDIKFSIRIHWGVYSMLGVEASWPYLNMSPEKKMEYSELYKSFNPTEFDAQQWMDFFKRSGIQAFAFTTKHHDGFSMFHTKTRVKQRANYLDMNHVIEPCDLAYSIEETPFKRDIVKELCDAAHKNGIKIDLYYSHPDWFDADFRPYNYHPLSTPDMAKHPENYYNAHGGNNRKTILTPDRTPEETKRLVSRHREQIHELLTNYGKIDMICFDQWLGRDIWTEMKETVKLMRQWQPDVMIRARGIGNYGDYYQPEGFVPGNKENTNMPWMSICLLGNIFAYDPVTEHYKGAPWVIHNLIDCVAKGGSFMVCIGPDQTGQFHPTAVKQLEEVGKWLKVNGEGIFETREREVWKENGIYFTRSKNHKNVYAFTEKFPEKECLIPSVNPKKGSKIYLFGYKKPLKWSQTDTGVKVIIPNEVQSPENRPCEHAWGFRIEVK
ncbi:MAG: alpha-L-fucosidase [Bacteroidales bacterium]|jgi:alpha-L-fucosidase|nr:alpha-L-fucosidase [Bacteroidales bacterium]